VNGYSGGEPPGWGLALNEEEPGKPPPPLEQELERWLSQNGVPRERVHWIHLGDPPDGL
jgi:hypothetical protein